MLFSCSRQDGEEYDVDGEPVIGGLEDLFKRFDTEGNGMLTMAQLRQVLKKMKIKLSGEELEVLQASFDVDGDGLVNYHEFKSFTMQSEGEELGTLWSRMRRALDKLQASSSSGGGDDDAAAELSSSSSSSSSSTSAGVLSPNSRRNLDRSTELERLLERQESFESGNGSEGSGRVSVSGLKSALEAIAMTLDNKTMEMLVKNFGVKRDGKEVSFLDVLRCAGGFEACSSSGPSCL